MTDGKRTCGCSPECAIPYGTCHCGCGEKTWVATQTQRTRGFVKGEPVKYVKGHAGRHVVHQLSDIDIPARTAWCGFCNGKVTIKSRGPAGRDGQPRWRCTRTLVTQHRLSKINELEQTAFCRGCEKTVPITRNVQRVKGESGAGWVCGNKRKDDAFDYREANRTEIQDKHKAWRDANPQRIRGYQVQRLYGVAIGDYLAEIERRGGRCDVCHEIPDGNGPNGQTLCVEHNHATGEVRGYADRDCNTMIGGAKDDPLRLAQGIIYLNPSSEQLAEIIRRLEWFKDVRDIAVSLK